MKRAIVLSGGGSKGAYQIGVWKALKKMHITYDIVTGTSVGALNAALLVQKDYLKALWLWFNMDFKLIFDQKIDGNYTTKQGKNNILKTYTHAVLEGGMNIEKLEQTVLKVLNVKKIYRSSINLGIVTVKIPTLKPILLTKNQIAPDQLKDYLIASASCFPAFQKKAIGDSFYIDGGLYDNLPINLAIEMGATEVIAVDLHEIGIKRKIKNSEIPITYISPRNDTGSFLVFNKDMSRRCMRLGYNDTMKIYGHLDGDTYTFCKNHMQKNYDFYHTKYLQMIKKYLEYKKDQNLLDRLIQVSVLKRVILNQTEKTLYQDFNHQIELLGKAFHIDDSKIYSIRKFNQLLKEAYQTLEADPSVEENIQNHKYKLLFHNAYTIKYLYDLMNKSKKIPYQKICRLSVLFPNEFLQAIYLKVILSK